MDNLFSMLPLLSGLTLIIGGVVALVLPHTIRQIWLLAVIAISAWWCWQIDIGTHLTTNFMGVEMILNRATAITKPFALVFHIAAALNVIYGASERLRISTSAAAIYAGAAIAALYAGDFLTLFIYWEATAFASVILVLAGNSAASFRAAMRYLAIQLLSGVLLLSGAAMLYQDSGALTITSLAPDTLAGATLFLAFAIKAAFPLLNGWLHDAYPQASGTGTIVLSAFTTKLAIYMLALCFAGTHILVWIGVVMAISPILLIAVEKDLRRLLTYLLNNQLGFMVIGIGIGSELAMNGVVAHAFASIIYQALLFMGTGAILLRTGTTNIDELGGLARKMPLTMLFTIIGALSITAFPLSSGFATKSLTIAAIGQTQSQLVVALVLLASGTLVYATLKLVLFAFFGDDSNKQVQEAPPPMLVAMALAALLCVGIGIAPAPLYALLPYEINHEIWTLSHLSFDIISTVSIGLVFVFLWRRGWLPPHLDTYPISSDWFYTRFAPPLIAAITRPFYVAWQGGITFGRDAVVRLIMRLENLNARSNISSGGLETGIAAGVILAVLSAILALRYFL